MDEERRLLAHLYAAIDTRIAALLAPLGRRLSLALTRAAERGTFPERRMPYLRALLDESIAQVFGTSPAAQFDDAGTPQTPIARLVGGGVRSATRIGLAPLFRDMGRYADAEILAALRTGRGGLARPLNVDPARTWVDPNGYRLSDRLWQSGQGVRDQLDALLDFHIKAGTDAVSLGRQIERFLTTEGATKEVRKKQPDGSYKLERVPRDTTTPYGTTGLYVPRRLARTEAARAAGVGTSEAARLSPWTRAIGWRLSAAHPREDICDGYAKEDTHGLGKGNYPKDAILPFPPHPQCLCHLTTVPVADPARVVADLGRWARGEAIPGFEHLDGESLDADTLVARLTGIGGDERAAA